MSTSFAVVIANHNYREFIAEAVDSALAQTRAPRQVIVVDDGSTDGSAELLQQRYGGDARVRLLRVANGGQLSASRQGVALADADVVCFLDSDDRWDANYLEQIGAIYDSRKDVDFVFSDMRMFGAKSDRISFADRPVDLAYTVLSTYLLHTWYGAPTSALSLRTRWARQVLDLPDDKLKAWRLATDNCVVFGASILGARKYFLPTGAVHYRIHGGNDWWSDQGKHRDFINTLRSRALIQFYAQSCGVSERLLDMARHEYLLKPDPPKEETERYARLLAMREGSWWTRWRRSRSLLKQADKEAS
ncbi:glycosyltransferase family 2 protein [Luteimonas panaciterrae]|uniref:glycosyltransferase family 2 protein n=1 Tax=Luteimonas panaciterrae TaxID=363885 RepID=UPI001CFAA494|nr:glycosyltransferase family A protein [Luteimonas panaciterrae]